MTINSITTSNVFLGQFQPCQLSKPIPQDKLLNYTSWLMSSAICVNESSPSKEKTSQISLDTKEKVNRFGVSAELINKRQFLVVPDNIFEKSVDIVDKLPRLHKDLFNNPNGDFLDVRMNFFKEQVYKIFQELYLHNNEAPNDLIHVTCAGYLSPSPAQEYVVSRQWYETQVTHSYHMGCYGAFPAVKMACGFIAFAQNSYTPKQKVDIVHTELVSTHLNVNSTDAGNIVNMTLFGDGFIKYSAYPEAEFWKKNIPGLKIITSHEEIIPDSLEEMTWVPGSYQFDMFLSKDVPLIIGASIKKFVEKICKKAGFSFEEKRKDLIYAIHPGGPKILNYIKDILQLNDDHIKYSKKVFLENGNMSSATIPHIWKEITETTAVEKGKIIITMAFGPGLTATGLILEKA